MSDNRSETNRKRKLSASTPVHSSTASKGTSSLSLSSIESKTNKRIRRKNVTFNYTTDIYEPKIYDSLSHDDDTKDKTLTLSDDKMASEYEFSSFPSCQQDSCKVGDHDRTYTKIKDNYTVNFHHSFRSESFLLEFPKPEKNFFPTSLDERNKPVRKKRPTRKKIRYPITTPSLTQSLGWMSIHKMRSEVGEWLATCVGSPICILLLSWSLLIYQNQPSALKRRIDVLTVAIITQSLAHQLGLLLYAILTLIRPTNHFGEICSTLVWLLNSSSILQELTLTSIAIFAAINSREESNVTKNHLKYHLVSLTVVSACIGFTGVLNFEPETCVFLAQEVSLKYGLFVNCLRALLLLATVCGLSVAVFRDTCRSPKSELLQSVSDLSETSSKNSSGPFECHPHHWDPSSGSCTSGSTNSRACLRKRKPRVDESGSKSTVFSILFVCYVFHHLPVLMVSIRPDILQGLCTPQNVAIWLPLIKDTLLPVILAIFDKMFCRYVAKVYTKQDNSRKLAHCGIDGKFRHFEQDAEYKLQLNLNHGLKFPLTNGSLYGRLHSHQNRTRTGTITMGIQHYPRTQSLNDDNSYGSLPAELTSFTSSTFEPRQHKEVPNDQQATQRLIRLNENLDFVNRRKIGTTDVFGQNMENLVQLDEPKKQFAKSLDEIREEGPRKQPKNPLKLEALHRDSHQTASIRKEEQEFTRNLVRRNHSFDISKYPRLGLDSRTYDVKDLIRKDKNIDSKRENFDQEAAYETSDDESCDFETGDFDDTMSSCKSRSCSVTTVANDDFEFFQRKGAKAEFYPVKNKEMQSINMRSFTPKIIDSNWTDTKAKITRQKSSKPTIHSYHLKKISPGYSMNDLDKLFPNDKQLNFNDSIKNYSNGRYIDEISRTCGSLGGSVPDFKKAFVTEFI